MVLKSPEDQYALFEDPSNLPRHDQYDPRHMVADLIRLGADLSSAPELPNVSVSLDERADTLSKAAEIYADYNKRTIGLGKAALIPSERKKLEERYGADYVDFVVSGAAKNSFYSAAESELDFDNPSFEQRMLEGVLKSKDFLDAGMDPTDLSAELQPIIVAIRHAIGTKVHGIGAVERNAEIKKVRATANRAKEISK